MGGRGTLILALLVLLAAAAFALSPAPKAPLSDSTLLGEPRFVDAETPSPKLLDFEPGTIEKMTLGYRDEVVTVARDGERWKGAANDNRLGDFLDSVAGAAVISTLEDKGNLADFGLDAPTRRLLLERQKGEPIVLVMGERNPAATSVYVRVGDGPVEIAGALLVWEFDKAFAAITGRKPTM